MQEWRRLDLLGLLWVILLLPEACVVGQGEDVPIWSHVLTRANFSSALAAAGEPWALVEFYASWCPACRYFKPTYEAVARVFNAPDSPHADFIYVAKVDCAEEGELCTRFAIGHFPTMLWGKPGDIGGGKREGGGGTSASGPKLIEEVECERTPEGVLAWVNKRTSRQFSLLPQKQAEEGVSGGGAAGGAADGAAKQGARGGAKGADGGLGGGSTAEPPAQVAAVEDMEEATVVAVNHMVTAVRLTEPARSPMLEFVRLLAGYHPSSRCRQGSSKLVAAIESEWQVGTSRVSAVAGRRAGRLEHGAAFNGSLLLPFARVCGARLPSNTWVQCRGSLPDSRGYSCGLWMLFHSLSVRLPDSDPLAGRHFLATVHGFVDSFFSCGTCRTHFLAMAKHTAMHKARSKREAALWLWRAHNIVNARLRAFEAASGGKHGDPKFPKRQWPWASVCPECRRAVQGALPGSRAGAGAAAAEDPEVETAGGVGGAAQKLLHAQGVGTAPDIPWDEDAVYAFLVRYYGEPAAGATRSQKAEAGEEEEEEEAGAGAHGHTRSRGATGGSVGSTWGVRAGAIMLLASACCVYLVVFRGHVFARALFAGSGLPRRR